MGSSIFKISIAIFFTTLTGCKAIGLDYLRPETGLPDNYNQASLQVDDNVVVESQWWKAYEDEKLNQLIARAFENNTNVMDAVARIEDAEAQMRIAGASSLPTVDFNGNGKRSRVTEAGSFPAFGENPRNNFNWGFNTAIEVDVWGKLKRAKESARAGYLASQYAKSTVMWSLSSLIANHYLQIRSFDSQLAVNQENQIIAQESFDLATRRFEGGVASKLDVYQAQTQLDDLKTQVLELQRLRALGEHQIQVLTGDLSAKVEVGDLFSLPVPPTAPAGLPSDLLASRPDIQQAEQQLVAANANVGLAKGALYPSISLTGNLGGESVELSDVLKSAARIWSLGVALDLPIFNSGKLNAKVDQASAQQKQTLAAYISSIRTAFSEVNDALVNVRSYRAQEVLALSKQETAKNMLEIAEHRYKEGYSSYLDVLEAQRNHQASTLAFVQSRQNVLIATVALFKALGGGWEKPAS